MSVYTRDNALGIVTARLGPKRQVQRLVFRHLMIAGGAVELYSHGTVKLYSHGTVKLSSHGTAGAHAHAFLLTAYCPERHERLYTG